MIFTTKAEYGVRLLVELGCQSAAGDDRGAPVSLKAIAETQGLPLAYLERIVALLRKAFEMLAQDKEFLAEIDKAKMEFDFVPGPEIDKIVAQISATPPEIAERYGKAFSPDAK
jgi:hypothetical protein